MCGLRMGWKQINGRSYYYRSVREAGRTRTEYVGTGEVAGLIAQLDLGLRAGRAIERAEREAERERIESEDREVAEWFDRVESVARVAMLTAGFHRHHRGEWRRRRDGRSDDRDQAG